MKPLVLAFWGIYAIIAAMLSAIFWNGRRRVHPSFLIAWMCGGTAFGVGLARLLPAGVFLSGAWAVLALGLAAVGFWRRRVWVVPVLIVAGLAGGLWRGSLVGADLAQYAPLYDRTVSMSGTVRQDPDPKADGSLTLQLGDISIAGRAYAGTVWVSTAGRTIERSDQVTVSGKLGRGFGTFAGSIYRARVTQVTRAAGADPARDLRDWFAGQIRRGVAEPQASLGIGFLVGQKSALPPDLSAAFAATGLTQAVVASGYNLTILVRLARRLFVRVSKYLAAAGAGTMIVGFMAVTGLSPSMTRAGLVSGLSLLAWYYGRTVHPLVLLSFAAAVTLLYNPSYAWGDLGWALSFSAFGGVMVLAPLLQAYFFGSATPGFVRQILGETLAATVATLPILVVSFGEFSNVSLLANALVMPLVPLAMLLTFIAGLGAVVAPPVAPLIGLPAQWLMRYMTEVATYLAGLPWALSHVTITPLVTVLSYVVLAGTCGYLRYATRGVRVGSEALSLL